ncbi:MAG: response regulator [Candidatus Thermoplasmatota archaeon]
MKNKDTITVLVIDDDKGFLDQAKRFIERADQELNVITALSAKEALNSYEREGSDAIVSDYQMPEMDGLELLKKIREEKKSDIPFIILTGRGREEVAMKALNLGADRYLQKSGDPKTQFEILANIITKEVEKITEKMYRNLLEFSPNPTVVLSKDRMVETANSEFLELIGKDRENVEGEQVSSVIVEKDENRLEKIHAFKEIDDDTVPSSYHTVVSDGSGEKKDVLISISLLPDSGKSIVNLFDVTEWVMNEQLISQIKNFELEGSKNLMEELSKKIEGVINEDKIKEDIQKNCLEELTILMIANEGKIHGKAIIDKLRERFGLSISAGTMYPKLHDLEDRDILEKHEGVQSKKYSLRNKSEAVEIAREKIRSVFSQYLLLYQLHRTYMNRD